MTSDDAQERERKRLARVALVQRVLELRLQGVHYDVIARETRQPTSAVKHIIDKSLRDARGKIREAQLDLRELSLERYEQQLAYNWSIVVKGRGLAELRPGEVRPNSVAVDRALDRVTMLTDKIARLGGAENDLLALEAGSVNITVTQLLQEATALAVIPGPPRNPNVRTFDPENVPPGEEVDFSARVGAIEATGVAGRQGLVDDPYAVEEEAAPPPGTADGDEHVPDLLRYAPVRTGGTRANLLPKGDPPDFALTRLPGSTLSLGRR